MRQETEQAKLDLQKQKLNLIRERNVAVDFLLNDDPSIPSGTPGTPLDDLRDLRVSP